MYSTNRGPSKLDIMNTENLPTTSGLTVKGHSQSENLFARLHSQAVNLPTRGSQSNNADTRGQCYSDHVTSKGMDVGEALSWLKREVLEMKQQDRALMRQLLDLRAEIHQLQGRRMMSRSGPDLTQLQSMSIAKPMPDMQTPGSRHDIDRAAVMTAFQTRTVSMVSVVPSSLTTKMPDRNNNNTRKHSTGTDVPDITSFDLLI